MNKDLDDKVEPLSNKEIDGLEGFTEGTWSQPHFSDHEIKCDCGYVFGGRGEKNICTVNSSIDTTYDITPIPLHESRMNGRVIGMVPRLAATIFKLKNDTNLRKNPLP